jgi:cytoskeletal protein CcmA (bactofilin family)
MFKKDSNQATSSGGEMNNKTNRIVEGTKITGDIVTQADFRLDGELIGNFKSNGKLVIGASGIIKGDVNCKNADIEGRFDGKIQVIELLNLKSTATIHGEVSIGKLAVEPGTSFTATCVMNTGTKTSNIESKA